jgi:hypothetical protein
MKPLLTVLTAQALAGFQGLLDSVEFRPLDDRRDRNDHLLGSGLPAFGFGFQQIEDPFDDIAHDRFNPSHFVTRNKTIGR